MNALLIGGERSGEREPGGGLKLVDEPFEGSRVSRERKPTRRKYRRRQFASDRQDLFGGLRGGEALAPEPRKPREENRRQRVQAVAPHLLPFRMLACREFGERPKLSACTSLTLGLATRLASNSGSST